MLKAIIFDFDGVICESIDIKKDAFRKMFLDYPEHLDEIVDLHMSNGGMSRFVKFEIIFRDILKQPLSKEKSVELGNRFSQYAYQGVLECPYVKGSLEFLKKYSSSIDLYVASGTPEEEMLKIVKQRNILKYFKGVYGSPRTKGQLASLILNNGSYHKDEVIFVGDAINDYQGAQEVGIAFIGRVHGQYGNPFQGYTVEHLVNDIVEMEEWLIEENKILSVGQH